MTLQYKVWNPVIRRACRLCVALYREPEVGYCCLAEWYSTKRSLAVKTCSLKPGKLLRSLGIRNVVVGKPLTENRCELVSETDLRSWKSDRPITRIFTFTEDKVSDLCAKGFVNTHTKLRDDLERNCEFVNLINLKWNCYIKQVEFNSNLNAWHLHDICLPYFGWGLITGWARERGSGKVIPVS